MAYNDTEKKVKKAAANDTAKKLKQEAAISKALHKHYKLVAASFVALYAKRGQLINTISYQARLQNILAKHYSKTANIFKSQIRDELGEPDKNSVEIARDINDKLFREGLVFVPKSADNITKTTQKVLNKHIKKAMADGAAAGVILTSRQIAKKVKNPFLEEMNNRADGVEAPTQTTFPAEAAKHSEINSLIKLGAVIAGVNILKAKKNKEWVTIIDGVTRHSHLVADGQKVPINQPFTVQGQKLMHPGDTTLGATIDNVAGCRCAMVISIK